MGWMTENRGSIPGDGKILFSRLKASGRAPGPIQCSIPLASGASSPDVTTRGVKLTTQFHAVPRRGMSGSISPISEYAFLTCTGTFTFTSEPNYTRS
jgi:hypothetical protein